MIPLRVSAWTKATDAEIRCPNPACQAANRPGVHYLDIEYTAWVCRCFCNACATHWVIPRPAVPGRLKES